MVINEEEAAGEADKATEEEEEEEDPKERKRKANAKAKAKAKAKAMRIDFAASFPMPIRLDQWSNDKIGKDAKFPTKHSLLSTMSTHNEVTGRRSIVEVSNKLNILLSCPCDGCQFRCAAGVVNDDDFDDSEGAALPCPSLLVLRMANP